jgi:hypothetical protein
MKQNLSKLQEQSGYGSHLPVTIRVIEATEGPILELGMGTFSTPILDLLCRQEKRQLVSYDDDPEWFKKNKDWESEYHKVYLVDNYDEADIENSHWSVALIDHKPAPRRIVEIKRLAKITDYLIVHDTLPEWDFDFKYSLIYPLFKYRFDYRKCRPYTTILSNFFDPKKFFSQNTTKNN